jgi:hypothetical protein
MNAKNLNPVDNFAAATDSKQTATLELTARQWRVIIIALNEAQTMPRSSRELSADIFELINVQLD